jgi:hypothetical protein
MKMPTPLIRLVLVAGLSMAALTAQGAASFEMKGFRGISWGDSAQRLGAATQVSNAGGVECYARPDENLMFGDSALSSVHYCFRGDRLFKVTLQSEGGFAALAAEFRSTYGRPHGVAKRRATWGDASSATRAELSSASQGDTGAMLSISSPRYAPAID